MKNLVICGLLLLSQNLMACPTLVGKWANSLEHFTNFNDRWAKGDKSYRSAKEQAQGKTTITFDSKGKMTVSVEAHDVSLSGHTISHPGLAEHTNYKITGCTDKRIAIKYELSGISRLSLLYFHDKNTYWEYKGGVVLSGHDHIREYFVRQ